MKFRFLSLAGLLIGLSACASDIMQGYVGRDITSVIAQYGPPAHEFDLPDGRRAFQWEMHDTNYVPETVTYEEEYGPRRTRGVTTTTGGYSENEVCFYTMYASPSHNGGWLVTGFEKPTFECE